MNEKTKTKALDALEGMRSIVRREMLVRGKYVEDRITSPELRGAICGGRKHCALGSLWAGAGVKARLDESLSIWYIPGVDSEEREDFLRHRSGLKLAYDSLNIAAERFAIRNSIPFSRIWKSSMEGLFEDQYGLRLTKRDLLQVISSAKRIVKAA